MAEELDAPPPLRAECEITKVGLDGVAVQAKVPHCWRWLWIAGEWTNKVQCSTCLKIEERGGANRGY